MDTDPFMKVTVPVGTPPSPETVAVKVTLIPVPAVSAEEVSVVALAAGVTVREKEATTVAGVLSESATWMAKVEVPAAVGVPEMTPVAAASDSPAGRLPEITLHA
jgi:hypothetical protein